MPQVASDPKIHAHSPTLARLARLPQQTDRAPSPFESLLDDGVQAADQPAPTSPENKLAPADNSQAQAKPNDCKPMVANDNGNIKQQDNIDPLGSADAGGKATSGSKTIMDVKLVESIATGDDTKAADGGKPADEQKTKSPTVTPQTDTTIIATDAIVATPPAGAPAPDKGDQGGQCSQQLTQATGALLPLKPIDTGLAKVGAGKQADASRPAHVEQQIDDDQSVDRATDETQLSAKVAPQAHDDTSHAGTSGSDKQPIAQTRGDLPSRGDPIVPDAPVSVSADAGATVMNASDNAVQPTVTAAPPHTTPAAPTAPAFVMPPGLQAAAIPISGVPLEIAGKALAGKNRFEIRLDPPELGRIEVRLDVDHDGNVTSRLTVDRAETLELLRRDASGLERALQDAGLKTSDNGLQFALRDQSMSQQQPNSGDNTTQLVVNDEPLPSIDATLQNYNRLAGLGGGIDIRV